MSKIDQIRKLITEEFEYFGRPVNASQIMAWTRDLEDLSVEEISKALIDLRKDPKKAWASTPAQIREQAAGFPTAAEAWADCPQSEDDTTVMTDEAAEAYGACRHMIQAGDFIGARRTFEAAYEAAVSRSRAERRKPKFFVSIGYDKNRRDSVLASAVERGRIIPDMALQFNPDLSLPAPKNPGHLQISGPKLAELPAPKEIEMTEEKKQEGLAMVNQFIKSLSAKTKMPIEPEVYGVSNDSEK